MNIRFYLDPETGAPHIYNHGVTEDEVEDIIRRPGEDRPGGKILALPSVKHRAGGSCGSSMCQTPSQRASL